MGCAAPLSGDVAKPVCSSGTTASRGANGHNRDSVYSSRALRLGSLGAAVMLDVETFGIAPGLDAGLPQTLLCGASAQDKQKNKRKTGDKGMLPAHEAS